MFDVCWYYKFITLLMQSCSNNLIHSWTRYPPISLYKDEPVCTPCCAIHNNPASLSLMLWSRVSYNVVIVARKRPRMAISTPSSPVNFSTIRPRFQSTLLSAVTCFLVLASCLLQSQQPSGWMLLGTITPGRWGLTACMWRSRQLWSLIVAWEI